MNTSNENDITQNKTIEQELKEVKQKLLEKEEELREAYKEIKYLKEEVESANKVKSQFLANMSHEIRTPMNGIMCTSELLSGTELSELQQEYVRMLKTSSDALLQIINDILDISKIESGKFKLNKESFNLRDTLEKIIKEFWVTSQSKGIELMYFIEPFVNLDLIGDSMKLNQVLINLINNSIKFTEKGHIYIRVSKVTAKSNSLTLLFSIEDTGVGISEEVKNKLFKVFSQGDDSYAKKYGGTGLGIAISKAIVTMMNGEIWNVSKQGEGSTFYFTAEFSTDNDPSLYLRENSYHKQSDESEHLSKSSKTILVVEDNKINQKVASSFLLKGGYKCLCASNGKQAIKLLEKEKIDLILMDTQMPELDGFETTSIIRRGEENPQTHLPIIAMTAYAMSEDRQKCIDAGMDDYISKPIDANELYKKIERYLV